MISRRRSISLISYWAPWPFAIFSIRSRINDVPTRQGVQKPQLSCAKKWAKFLTISNMSRSLLKMMKEPAVGTSSKAMRRPNSCGATQTPDAPLT